MRSGNLRTKNKTQNVFDIGSRSDRSFTVQEDTEVILREVKGGTKINCYVKENQSDSQNSISKRKPRYTLCDIEHTSKDVVRRRSSRQSESTNRSSMCWCHWPHMNTHKQVTNAQPQFINKVVDDRVKVQKQVPQSKWR